MVISILFTLSSLLTTAFAQTGDPVIDGFEPCRTSADRPMCIAQLIDRCDRDQACIYRIISITIEMARNEATSGAVTAAPVVIPVAPPSSAGTSDGGGMSPIIVGTVPITMIYLYSSSDCYGGPLQSLPSLVNRGTCSQPGWNRTYVNSYRMGIGGACVPYFRATLAHACANLTTSM